MADLTPDEHAKIETVLPASEWDYDPARFRVEVAAVVEKIIADREPGVRATALREAADAMDDAQTPDNEVAAAIRRDPAAWLHTRADAVGAGHHVCDTCSGLGRVPHMSEGDPYGHERDDDGMTRCLDCHGVGHV